MKKTQTYVSLIFAIMKFSFLQICLGVVMAGVVTAAPGVSNGQGVLDEVISISVANERVKTVLTVIEKSVGVKFTYNPQSIPLNQKITVDLKDKKLSEVLTACLTPLNIHYELSGEYIILSKFPLIRSSHPGAPAENAVVHPVTGRITDEVGAPIPGVNVVEKGTTNGTSSDADGKYALNVFDGNAILVFSFIGYETNEVTVGSRSVVDVTLAPDTKTLQEVVVVGYGTQKKGEITSAITNISPDEFNKGNISNIAQLLQGKVAGLSISRPGGDPNGAFSIRLRGLSSLGASQPLIVIDGQAGADLNSVDPNDIKSIDVLKDGSAAAIYGTRGSAGVIIITTKSGAGAGQQTTASYNGLVQAENAARLTPHMTADEFRAIGGNDLGSETDWYDQITRTAISHTHNLSLGGSNASGTSYTASFNFRGSQGVAITTGFDQLNGRLNLSQSALKDRLIFNINLVTTRRNADLGWSEAFKYAVIYNPTAPIFDPANGQYYESGGVDYNNPLAVLKQNSRTMETKRQNLVASAEYEIMDGLKFLTRYAQQSTSDYEEVFLPRDATFSRNFLGVSGNARGGYIWKRDYEGFNQLYENTLTFERKLGLANLSVLGGYSYQDFENKEFRVGGGNFITDASAQSFVTAQDFTNGRGDIQSYKNANRLVAFFGRLNLNFNDVAYFTASLRREGSTQFGANNKWGMFPAVSAGANIDQIIDLPAVDALKVRASYGITGSLPRDSYLSLQTLAPGGSKFYVGNNVYISSYLPNKNANPDLKWEKKGEFDIGVDFAMLNNRLTGSADYYNRTTTDLIFNVFVPQPPNLSNRTWKNIGKLESNGVELSVGYDVFDKSPYTWNTRVNFTTFNIHLAELSPDFSAGSYIGETNMGTPGQEQTQITRAMVGEDIGILWGLKYQGVDETGKYIFEDINNDGIVNNADETIIGHGLPDFEFGWSNTFTYKNFDFNFLLRGSVGHDLINSYRAFYETPVAKGQYNVVNSKYFNPNINTTQVFSSLHVEDASFVKLDNATVGYTFPFAGERAVKSLRAFLSGQNLFMITDYTGVDPEVRYADGTNVLAPGVDRRETWVWTRSFTLGVNVQF
ncbi:MAG TPA: SusC/RagA family TonB-linked outer membrane protein [Chryseosolibacter sp.]|nr:SusC/RagA family TonB-linked outer membrane protein [Chryseosolibacter sp.]